MNIKLPQANGWQFCSLKLPSVVALTCANTSLDWVLEARRSRFMQFQAGMVEVKMAGPGPREGGV
jgi:hypothetical protein